MRATLASVCIKVAKSEPEGFANRVKLAPDRRFLLRASRSAVSAGSSFAASKAKAPSDAALGAL